MGVATLHIDLDAVVANWRALDAMTDCATGAVVKADGYGLGAGRVARALLTAGCDTFFAAVVEEGAALREAVGPDPKIYVFTGHMPGDTDMLHDLSLTPMLNSIEQMTRHFDALPGHGFGVQLDTGMNRLGLEEVEWKAARSIVMPLGPEVLMSHLACADDPDLSMNAQQLSVFLRMTEGLDVTRSLAATGGILLGPEYHFDLTRPGVGLYGGLPFAEATPVVRLSLPVIQVRDLAPNEHVGYGCTWTADEPAVIATVSGGYADGLLRAIGNEAMVFSEGAPCPIVGRVSMDLITVDITHLDHTPVTLDVLCPEQSVDDLAEAAGTIGYEILTSLGARYVRRYSSGQG